jgi:hypothetical protein
MEDSGANTNEGCGEGSILKLASLAKVKLMGGGTSARCGLCIT